MHPHDQIAKGRHLVAGIRMATARPTPRRLWVAVAMVLAVPFANAYSAPIVPVPPKPLAIPDGAPEARAVALAEAVGEGSPDRLAGWLAVYEAMGIPVFDPNGIALTATGDDPVGPPFWRLWYVAGMIPSRVSFPLTDFVKIFNDSHQMPFDTEQAGAVLLQDLRAAALATDAQKRLLGLFTAELVMRARADVNLLDPNVTADKVYITGDLAELLSWVVIRGLVINVAAEEAISTSGHLSEQAANLVSTRSPLAVAGVSEPDVSVALNVQAQAKENCAEAAGSEDVTYWLNWFLNKLGGGFQLPGMIDGTQGFVEIVQRQMGVSEIKINNVKNLTAKIGAVTSILTLMMQLASLQVDSIMEPDVLQRTRYTRDGDPATIHFRLMSDPGMLPDGDNLVACLSSFVLNAFGVTLEFPTSGRIAGTELAFEGGKGFGQYVLFADYQTMRQDTNVHGEVALPVLGKAQSKEFPPDAERVMREFSVHVSAQPKAVTGKTIFDTFFAGLSFGAAPSATGAIGAAVDILKTCHWDLGERFFPLKDWSRGWRVDGFYWDAYRVTGTICGGLDKPFSLQAEASLAGVPMIGRFAFTPAGKSGGVWNFAGSFMGYPATASGSFQTEGVEEGSPSIRMGPGRWTVDIPRIGTVPIGEGGDHLDKIETIWLEPAAEECLGG